MRMRGQGRGLGIGGDNQRLGSIPEGDKSLHLVWVSPSESYNLSIDRSEEPWVVSPVFLQNTAQEV